MNGKLKILLLEDSVADADLLIRFLDKQKIEFDYTRVWNKNMFINEIHESSYDLIIADHSLPQFSGMEAFHICRGEKKNLPFILVTGSVSEQLLTEYAKEGIDDYILKDNLLRLPSAIQNVVSKKKIERLNSDLSATNKKLNDAYFNIKDSIDYAKMLQDAILPDVSLLHETFDKSFIVFKPKDILSGDFFWFDKKEDTFYISVVDCTGHGVPGALLAMMGNNLLIEAVNIKKLSEPSTVLHRMNKQVRRVLRHEKTAIRDGMDMVFCNIDLKTKILTYAGANRPLFIEREKELIILTPDKMAIGGMDTDEIKFNDKKILLKPGDRIFLFTDGYADQFSEKTNKKIKVKRLKELMIESSSLPYSEQKSFFINFFENWKGKHEQIDDVLLMCIVVP